MIGPVGNVRVYLASGATDMRQGIEGLIGQAETVIRQVPSSGAVLAFRGKPVLPVQVSK